MTMTGQGRYKQVLDSGGTLKEPLPDGESDSLAQYLKNFPYTVNINIGQTYTQDFKELYAWCTKHLGVKYKDWFLAGHGGVRNSKYTLYLKDNKKSLFLALKYSESVDSLDQL